MREILFRGKRTDNGEWIYGYLVKSINEEETYILPNIELCDEYNCLGCGGNFWEREVDHATIEQYTGLPDKNGKKIFEGDILQIWHKNPYTNQERKDNLGVVIFEDGLFGYQKIGDRYKFVYKIEESDINFNPNESDYKTFEIIGNIHDNPELLEVKQ